MDWNINAPLILAHRGFHAELPENTLPAFAKATELNFDGIETDVQLDCCGVPILFHDLVLQDGRPVKALTKAELSETVGYQVPLLADALDAGRGMVWDIEIKDVAAVLPSSKVLREFSGIRDIFVSSFVHSAVRELVESLGIPGALLVAHCPDGALFEAANLIPGINWIVWDCDTVDLKALEWAKSIGLRNMVYGYRPGTDHAKFLTHEVTAVITNFQEPLQSEARLRNCKISKC